MKSIARRDVLKGIAALPLVGQPHSSKWPLIHSSVRGGGPVPAVTTLNLIFHGLHAFVLWEKMKYFEVLAPVVEGQNHSLEHRYCAGGRTSDSLTDLRKGQTYRLLGTLPASWKSGPSPDENTIFHDKTQIDRNGVYCSLLLPPPASYHSLRSIEMENGEEFYRKFQASHRQPKRLPLTFVMSYDINDVAALSLDPFPMKPIDNGDGTAYLHIRAEAPEAHSADPIASLKGLFPGLEFEFNGKYLSYTAGLDPQTSLPPGILQDDERFMCELGKSLIYSGGSWSRTGTGNNYKEGGGRLHPNNCQPFLIKNP